MSQGLYIVRYQFQRDYEAWYLQVRKPLVLSSSESLVAL